MPPAPVPNKIGAQQDTLYETIDCINQIVGELDDLNASLTGQIRQKNYLNFKEAADYLGMSQSELEVLIKEKGANIPYLKTDGTYIFHRAALDAWLSTAGQKEYQIYD